MSTNQIAGKQIDFTNGVEKYKEGEADYKVKLSPLNEVKQMWEEKEAVNHMSSDFEPWFTLVQGEESPTHYIEMSFTVRIDADGNPMPIQRQSKEAADNNDRIRQGLNTNPHLHKNNLSLCGNNGLESEVLISPHKANVVEIALDEDGDIIQVDDGDHYLNFVFAPGNAKTDIIGKLDTTDNAETGKSQQGQTTERKVLRELLLKGATEKVVSHYDFIAEEESCQIDDHGFISIEAEDFEYCGKALKDLIEPERFALVVLQGVGVLKKSHKAKGHKNSYRRFEIQWASSWVLDNLTKGGNSSSQAPKGNKLAKGIKFPSNEKKESAKSTPSSSSKDILKDVHWRNNHMTLMMNEDDTVEDVIVGEEAVSEKGWVFEQDDEGFVLLGKEDKVLFFLKEGKTFSVAHKFLAKHKAKKNKEDDIFLSDGRKVYFYYGFVEDEYVSGDDEEPNDEEPNDEEPNDEEPNDEEPNDEDDGLEGEMIDYEPIRSISSSNSEPKQEKPASNFIRRPRNGGENLNKLS